MDNKTAFTNSYNLCSCCKFFPKIFLIAITLFSSILAQSRDSMFTFYGLAQYRLRIDYTRVSDNDRNFRSAIDYSNRIGFYWGTVFSPSPDFMLQFQLGNDWVSTETVTYPGNNPATVTEKSYPPFSVPYFHLAFIQWTPGLFTLTAGKVPLLSYGPLDLIEQSLATGTYSDAALISWAVASNNSLMGIRAGVPLFESPFSLEINLFSTVLEPRRQVLVEDSELTDNNSGNFSSIMNVLDLPFSMGKFSLTPQLVMVFNRNYNAIRNESDHEIAGGITVSYTFPDSINVFLMSAYARLSNTNSLNPVDSSFVTSAGVADFYDQRGFVTGTGLTAPLGPGTLIFEVRYSNDINLEDDSSASHFLFGDLRYNWNPNRFFSITPRIRLFTTFFPRSSSGLSSSTLIRPELIFTGQI